MPPEGALWASDHYVFLPVRSVQAAVRRYAAYQFQLEDTDPAQPRQSPSPAPRGRQTGSDTDCPSRCEPSVHRLTPPRPRPPPPSPSTCPRHPQRHPLRRRQRHRCPPRRCRSRRRSRDRPSCRPSRRIPGRPSRYCHDGRPTYLSARVGGAGARLSQSVTRARPSCPA